MNYKKLYFYGFTARSCSGTGYGEAVPFFNKTTNHK
jgi:hypothetical protein